MTETKIFCWRSQLHQQQPTAYPSIPGTATPYNPQYRYQTTVAAEISQNVTTRNSQMTRFDAFIQRLPGSIPFKSFVAACIVCTAAAYPVFSKPPEESRQGHDYMSSEKPEAIRSSEEQLRREYRDQRRAKFAAAQAAAAAEEKKA